MSDNEKLLIQEYIGINSIKIIDGKLNWVAASLGIVLGPIWFFYRKAYFLGLAFLIVTCIFVKLFNLITFSYAYELACCTMMLVYLFFSNQLYIWNAKKKVNKMISKQSEIRNDELIKLINKKGGTSSISAIAYIVLTIFMLIMSGVLISLI